MYIAHFYVTDQTFFSAGKMARVQMKRKQVVLCVIPIVLMMHLMAKIFHSQESQPHQKDTILLIWFWPLGHEFEPDSCTSKFNIDGCHLTADRSLYTEADGVLLHQRDIAKDLSNLPKLHRPFFQQWVGMLFESPEDSSRIPGLDNLFNITMSYQEDADIVVHRKLVLKHRDTEESNPLPTKTKSFCRLDYGDQDESPERLKYYSDLKELITVEVLRQHTQNSAEVYSSAVKSCKFHLALESTKHSDEKTAEYMAEKLHNSLHWGTVPVVSGLSRKIYEGLIPRGAFIHMDDFNSPKGLADYLSMLDENEDKYDQFLSWRKNFSVTHFAFPLEHACLACSYIRETTVPQVFSHIGQWEESRD